MQIKNSSIQLAPNQYNNCSSKKHLLCTYYVPGSIVFQMYYIYSFNSQNIYTKHVLVLTVQMIKLRHREDRRFA